MRARRLQMVAFIVCSCVQAGVVDVLAVLEGLGHSGVRLALIHTDPAAVYLYRPSGMTADTPMALFHRTQGSPVMRARPVHGNATAMQHT